MTTIYVTQNAREDGGHLANATQNGAKDDARAAYERDGEEHHVMKVELNEDIGKRELMCALFNGEASKYSNNHTVIYTAPARRGRKSKEDGAPESEYINDADSAEGAANEDLNEDNPFGI